MSKLFRMLPLMLFAAALAMPVSASAVSSNGRSDRRTDSDDSSETRRSGDRDRDSSRRGDRRSESRRGDSRRDDRRSDSRRGSRSADERRRSDSSEGGSYSHSRSSGSRHSSHRSSSHHTRTHRYGHGHRTRSYDHRVVVRSSPNVVYVQRPRVIVRHDPYYEPMYLGDQALANVLYDLDRATFSSDKMNIIRHVAGRYTLSTHAAKRMVRRLTFSNDRVEALEMLYPRVHDKENWYRVYDLLTFSSDRDRLRSRCGY